MDHIMGLYQFFFLLRYNFDIHIYGEARNGISLSKQLETVMGPPYWPVDLAKPGEGLTLHELGPGSTVELGDHIKLEAVRGNHPDLSLLYKLSIGGKRIFYGLDCEMDETVWKQLVAFGEGCDLLICDAQYRPEEMAVKKGWGHSSWKEGNALLRACRGGVVWHSHYDWRTSDSELRERVKLASKEEPKAVFVKEGSEMIL